MRCVFGRDDETWDELTDAALDFLIERAKLRTHTTYTEINAVLVRRTGKPGFDFNHENERAAMGHLLGRVVDRNYPKTGHMITALVQYLNANDAGPGFYQLATQMGLLRRGASAVEKEAFWISQVNGINDFYKRRG